MAKKKTGKARWILLGVIVLVLLILIATGTFVVRQNEYGVILQFGAVTDMILVKCFCVV